MSRSDRAPLSRISTADVPPPLRPTDAQRVRDLMSWGGLTEEDAARELGVDADIIRAWRAGKTPPPRMAILALERLVDKQRRIDTWI